MHKWIGLCVVVSFFLGLFGSSNTSAYTMSYVPKVELGAGVFRDGTQWVNETKSVNFWWQPPVGYNRGDSGYVYLLFKQFNNGAWQPIVNTNGNQYFSSWDMDFTLRDAPLGRYKFRVRGCFYIDGSYPCEEPGKDSVEVIVRAPPPPPAKPTSINVGPYTKLLANSFIFETEYLNISIGNYIPPGVTHKFYKRNLGEQQWILLSGAIIRGSHLDKLEVAAEACNQYGCSEKKILTANVLFDLPEVKNSNFSSHLTPINVFGSYSNGTQICVANPITGKCSYDYMELRATYLNYVGNSSGINPLCLVSKGVVLECNAIGSFNYRITSLAMGVHTFEIRAPGATGVVLERIHYEVYLPSSGQLTANTCEVAVGDQNCVAAINWTAQGNYPVCLYKIIGTLQEELSCSTAIPSGQLPVNLTASPEEYRLVAKEPGGEKVLSSLNISATVSGVSLTSTIPTCEISKPNTSCHSNINWSISTDYPSACVFKNGVLIGCDASSARDLNMAPGTYIFEVRNGPLATSSLLATTSVLAKYIPSGSIIPANGYTDTCVPINGATSCVIEVDITHWNVNKGATLYKNNVSWADFGLSSNGTPFTGKYSLTADQGGTHWSLRTMENGVLKEFASLDLFSTTLATSGYELLAANNQCDFNPLVANDCEVQLDWKLPALGGCVFEKGTDTPYYCPPNSPGSGGAHIKPGTTIYQLRETSSPSSALKAQVAVVATEQIVSSLSSSVTKCSSPTCTVNLTLFTNSPKNVCLFDNDLKVADYCNLYRHNQISNYALTPSDHKLQLVDVTDSNDLTVLNEINVEKYVPPVTQSSTLSVAYNSVQNLFELSWAKVDSAYEYRLYKGTQQIYSGSLLQFSVPVESKGVDTLFRIAVCDPVDCVTAGEVVGNFPVSSSVSNSSTAGTAGLQGAVPESPTKGEITSDIPYFSALETTLDAASYYKIVVSEAPRSLVELQYVDYWSAEFVKSESLVVTNPKRLHWDTNWAHITRNGDPSGERVTLSVTSPPTLTIGKTYYWHLITITGDRELIKSEEYSFTVGYSHAETMPYVLALLSPQPGAANKTYVGAAATLLAGAFDLEMKSWIDSNSKPPRVEYFLGDQIVDLAAPSESGKVAYWSPSQAGEFKIHAKFYFENGNVVLTKESNISVVEFTTSVIELSELPQENLIAGTSVNLVATLVDPDHQVGKVVFFANGEAISADKFSGPYRTTWIPVAPGDYSLVAEYFDHQGNRVKSDAQNVRVVLPDFEENGGGVSDYGNAQLQGLKTTSLAKSDLLVASTPNATTGVSYNKLSKFLVNRPLKIVNRSDVYESSAAASLIIIDADDMALNSSVEIIGEKADVLFINSSANNQISCQSCSLRNMGRVMLAVATPDIAFNNNRAQLGVLSAKPLGLLRVNAMDAAGVVSLELVADKVEIEGAVNTQLYGRVGTNDSALELLERYESGAELIGSGGVSLLHGRLKLNYDTLSLDGVVSGADLLDIRANITAGAINITSTAGIRVQGSLSTTSKQQALQIYRNKVRAQNEIINIKNFAQTEGSKALEVTGSIVSDNEIDITSPRVLFAEQATVSAAKISIVSDEEFVNRGVILGVVNDPAPPPELKVLAGSVDNRGSIKSNVGYNSPLGSIIIETTKGDILNRFGGLMSAESLVLNSAGKIRNGSLYAFDNAIRELDPITLMTFDTSRISTLSAAPNSNGQLSVDVRAKLTARDITLVAVKSVENINPFTEPFQQGTAENSSNVLLAQVSARAARHTNDVTIEALRSLNVTANTYLLNSSAVIGVSAVDSAAGELNRLSIQAPKIRNERYYTSLVLEKFSDFEQVVSQIPVGTETVTNKANGVQSRFGFYSPPGYIYSLAKTELNFTETTGADKGLLNNASYFDLYGDLYSFGVGGLNTIGLSLEKLAYGEERATYVRLNECVVVSGNGFAYPICNNSSGSKASFAEGKVIAEYPDNTVFAVDGNILAKTNLFDAKNIRSIEKARTDAVYARIALEMAAPPVTGPWDSSCNYAKSYSINDDNTFTITTRFWTDVPYKTCSPEGRFESNTYKHRAYYNISAVLNDTVPSGSSALKSEIENYTSWWKVN